MSGGHVKNTAFMLIVAGLLAIAPAHAQSVLFGPTGEPPSWDERIPLPSGAKFKSSSAPKGGRPFSADFVSPLPFSELVNFYDTELPKAGFKLNDRIAIASHKVYRCTFTDKGILDKVDVSPSIDDPSYLIIHIAYTPARAAAALPSSESGPSPQPTGAAAP